MVGNLMSEMLFLMLHKDNFRMLLLHCVCGLELCLLCNQLSRVMV